MLAHEFFHGGRHWVRVDKRTARRVYNNGLTAVWCPCNMRPFGPWWAENGGVAVNRLGEDGSSFDSCEDTYKYYNCDNERGRYISFYIPIVTNKFDGRPEYDYAILEDMS